MVFWADGVSSPTFWTGFLCVNVWSQGGSGEGSGVSDDMREHCSPSPISAGLASVQTLRTCPTLFERKHCIPSSNYRVISTHRSAEFGRCRPTFARC